MSTKKRVLLATSAAPSQTPFSTYEKRSPIGIGFLISVLRNAGHEVFFIDNYLQPSNFLETDYLQRNRIDYVGIYANTICYRDTLRMFYRLEYLRRAGNWNGKIIVGGPHTTVALDTIPNFVDYVVQGEGERAIVDIVEDRASNRVVWYPPIKNLDELPMPAWDYFVHLPYKWSIDWLEGQPIFTMNTSRGCPFQCTFCSVGSIWGKRYTYFNAERIVSDIEHLIKHYNAKGIYFREDNFTLNRNRLIRFCNLLIEKGINISWTCETRVNTLDREIVKLMYRAGARAFYFGVESGSQKILDFLKKGITAEQTRNAFKLCNEFGIKTAASVIVGVPTETEKDIKQTIKLIEEIKPTVTWYNVFVGIPDSGLCQYVKENKLYEFIDDRGLVYLKGHNERVKRFYGDSWNAYIPCNLANPKISVVMSVYNGSNFLENSIKSILTQSYQDFEFIIINDASTDSTTKILKKIDDPRVRIITNPKNLGLTKSLNKGIEIARGKYIARMDADDISLPHRFETQLDFLEKNLDYALVGSSLYQIDDSGRTTSIINLPTDDSSIKGRLRKGNQFGHGSVMIRKDVLLQSGKYNERFKYSQDYDLWLRIAETHKVANIGEPLYYWRLTKSCISMEKGAEQKYYADLAISEAQKRELVKSSQCNGKREFRVIAIIAAHNEGDVIYHVIGDLVKQGIEVYFINHCSTDNTVQEASKWLGKGLIHIENFPQDCNYPEQNKKEYIWSHILRRKQELAASLDADWFIHHDADEFRESPWHELSLREAIYVVDRNGYNAIDFALFNFHPTDNSFAPGTDVRETIKYYEQGEDFNKLQIKAWKKHKEPVDLITHGGHNVTFNDKKTYPIKFILRHYPIRSQSHGVKKVFQERKKRFNAQERRMNWHIQYNKITTENYSFLHNASNLKLYDENKVRLLLLSEQAYTIKQQLTTISAKEDSSRKKPAFVSHTSDVKTGLATSILNRGNTLINLGKLDEAIKEFEKLVNLHPDYSDGYLSLASAYYKRGDLPKAEENFKKAIELDANNIIATKNLAYLYFDKKDYNQAVSACEAVLLKDSKDAETLVLLSDCYFEMNAYEAALIGYEKALELSPKLKDAKKGQSLVKVRLKTNKKSKPCSPSSPLPLKISSINGKNNKKIKNKAKCSIIIPTYNKVEYTKQCLESLFENTDYENYEIIVVDNASTDGTKDFLKTFNGTINVIANNNNLGFARACNQGAKIATGKYLVFLNNDTTLHPGWLTEMVKLIEADERIAVVGNKQIYPPQNISVGGMIWHAGVVINENRVSKCIYNGYDQNHPFTNKIREFPAVAGSCMLVRKDVFEKLNGFDEIYLNSHEDIDFCLRAREAGYKVMYCPKSVIEHHVSVSEGRHDSESRNAEVFKQRWVKRLEPDDWKYYQEDAKEFLDSYKFRNLSASGNGHQDMPFMGFLSTYNQKCGLATYAQQLLAYYDPSRVLIFAEHGKDILPEPDPINLIRCWTRYSPDYHFVAELVRKQNMQLIHINNQRGLLSEPLVDLMSHLHQDSRRIIVTFHSTVRFNMTERGCFNFIDKAIVHTPENKLELIANGCDEKKIVVIPHGVPVAKLVDKYSARQKLNLSALGGSNIITSFGFVQESKGIHEIIEAVARLKANGIPVKYFILGTYHPHNPDSKLYLEKCKALALRLGVANLVAFKDEYLSDDTVLQYLSASDAIIMNYKSNTYESSGAAAFAISACRPLITSNAPMFATFGDACLHIGDAYPLELAIYNVLSDPFLRNYLQKNTLKFIEENNWQRIAEKHLSLYAEVMNKTNRTSFNLLERYGSHPDNIYDEDFQRERIDWLKFRAEGRILEVGCATGFVSEYVGAFAAIDIDEGRLGVSNRLRKSCRFIKADATKGIPFKDKSFDTVILAEVLEHVPFDKSKTMLSEAIRVGKKILITIPYDGEAKHEELSNNIEHFWLGNEENVKELFSSVSNMKPKIEFSSKMDFILVEQKVGSTMPQVPSTRKIEKKRLTSATTKNSEDTNQSNPIGQSIHWLGGFFGLDGYSNAARNYALGLSEIGVDISTEPLFDNCPITRESQ